MAERLSFFKINERYLEEEEECDFPLIDIKTAENLQEETINCFQEISGGKKFIFYVIAKKPMN